MIHAVNAEDYHADAPGQRLDLTEPRSAVRSEVDCGECAPGLHADEIGQEYRDAHDAGEHTTSWTGCPVCMGFD